jgi:uncharacterized membrane protein
MEILIWILGFVLLFIGSYLMFFPEKFLSYDSKLLPNFWDPHGRDIVLLNWKSRRLVTFIIGIVFFIGSIVVFLTIYLTNQAKLA